MMSLNWVLAATISLCLICGVVGRSVSVDVKAPWSRFAGSFAAEVSEFLAEESDAMFWKYVDAMCVKSSDIEALSGDIDASSSYQALAFEAATEILPKSSHALMNTVIGLNSYAPAVQFFHSMASPFGEPCDDKAFVVSYPGGDVSCSVEEAMDKAAKGHVGDMDISHFSGTSYEWDHLYSSSSSDDGDGDGDLGGGEEQRQQHLVLYGSLGSASFCALHAQLVATADKAAHSSIKYSARHAFPGQTPLSTSTRLQGYGVFLDIKNMEYKNVDDKKDGSSDASDPSDDDIDELLPVVDGEEIAGVNLAKLAAARPELSKQQLSTLKGELLQVEELAATQDEDVKVWKMKDLGLQTAYSVVHNKDPAARFRELVHNFPSQAASLSTIRNRNLEKTSEAMSMWFQSAMARTLPVNAMFVNGVKIDLGGATFNVYDVFSKIREEYSQASRLRALGLDSKTEAAIRTHAEQLSATAAASRASDGEDIVRIDVSKGAKHVVTFANNLEKDAQYKQMPRTLMTLLQPTWSLHQVRRNLYTMLANLDVSTESGALIYYQLLSMVQQQFPVRLGIVPVCDLSVLPPSIGGDRKASLAAYQASRGPSSPATSLDVCLLFARIRAVDAKEGPLLALDFLTSISSFMVEQFQKQQEAAQAGADGSLAADSAASGGVTVTELIDRYVGVLTGAGESSYSLSRGGAFDLGITNAQADTDSHMTLLGRVSSTAVSATEGLAAADAAMPFLAFAQNCSGYHAARNLPANSYSLNGIVKSDVDLNSVLMSVLGREQQMLSQMVVSQHITDKVKSIFAAVLKHSSAYARYHPLLDQKGDAMAYVDASASAIRSLRSKYPHFVDSASSADTQHPRNTTVVVVPVSIRGLETVRKSLQWLLHGGDEDYDYSPSGNEEGDSGDAVAFHQRLQVVFAVPPSSSSSGVTSDDGTDGCVAYAAGVIDDAFVNGGATVSGLIETIDSALDHSCDVKMKAGSAPIFANAKRNYRLLQRDRAVNAAMTAKGSSSADVPSFIIHNSRLLVLTTTESAAAAEDGEDGEDQDAVSSDNFHPLDLALLASVEQQRLGTPLEAFFGDSESIEQLSSFVGLYGAGAASSARHDTHSVLSALAAGSDGDGDDAGEENEDFSLVRSHLMFTVDPAGNEGDADSDNNDVTILYYLDPLTVAGQRAAAVIKLLSEHLSLKQTVFLLPRLEVQGNEFPLQNYYRFVLAPHSVDGDNSPSAAVGYYSALPRTHTLTVRTDAPEPWNLQAVVAQQDPDNLICAKDSNSGGGGIGGKMKCGDRDVNGVVTAVTTVGYELKSILVAGQCFERTRESELGFGYPQPPNGLQLVLASAGSSNANDTAAPQQQSDTLVMQNLGYFQLQATPGIYSLTLAAGKASDLFTIDGAEYAPTTSSSGGVQQQCEASVDGDDCTTASVAAAPTVVGSVENKGFLVAVKSFAEASSITLSVAKRPGMESVPLLEPNDGDDERMMTKRQASRSTSSSGKKSEKKKDKKKKKVGLLSSLFGGEGEEEGRALTQKNGDDDTIHVFSLATGHMYERLLRIMMLSVTKRTSRKVHFWLFENYLSPTFKKVASAMASIYGFQVSYVTYKWPHWLTQQTQKQRIIWGYKILFLDVLFPLDVKKVIYVDADQVVRADLAELWDMDLHGKPYAYTPFCDSREETLGFQFWRSGYWHDHLRGQPYHISALYVVDLDNFRRNAVGDELRSVYDSLARDPNSLANLDQDLPNYAQHSVPIHSLPQEWLWCETWCSDSSKKEAKTIDLCNNPLHKEPKLDMARRVIDGAPLFKESWVELDEEVSRVEAGIIGADSD